MTSHTQRVGSDAALLAIEVEPGMQRRTRDVKTGHAWTVMLLMAGLSESIGQ